MKNLELLIQPLDQKLNDFDEEKQNFYEKYDSTIMPEQDLRLNYKGLGNLEPHESRTLEDQQSVWEVRSEIMQLEASAVPPRSGMARQEAKIENEKAEMKSLRNQSPTTIWR